MLADVAVQLDPFMSFQTEADAVHSMNNQGTSSLDNLFDLSYSWGGLDGGDLMDTTADDPFGFRLDSHPNMFWSSFAS